MLLGAGGMHIAEREANEWTYLPGPIGISDDLPAGATDGGLVVDDLSKSTYVFLQNFAHTFRGGLHLRGTGGGVGIESGAALGAAPASPADVVFFEGPSNTVSSLFVGHGHVTLDANRNLGIGDGVTARVGAYNASSSLTLKGTISCENPETGFFTSENWQDTSTGLTLDPGAGRTNHIGRLYVRHPLTIASGTTLLENTMSMTDSQTERWDGINTGSPLYVLSGGTLAVTGGELLKPGKRNASQSGTLAVSGGLVDLAGTGGEFLQATAGPATTTVKGSGRLLVNQYRIAGDGNQTDASKSVLNLETGGVLRVAYRLYIHENHPNYKATVNLNGGTFEWANTASAWAPFAVNGGGSGTAFYNSMNGIAWNVREGGFVVSNDCNCYFYPAPKSAAAADGGVTKWGRSTFALFNTGNDFNGPVSVMQGAFRLGNSGVIPASGTVRVAPGAFFYNNTYPQTLARIEGGGTFGEVFRNGTTLLSVTSAIAPGMGADEVGTLTVSGGGIDIASGTALEIDIGENGACDKFSYPSGLALSSLRLVVNDASKLDKNYRYEIVSAPQGCIEEFASTNLPDTWHVKYGGTKVELAYTTPFVMVVR